MPPALSCSPWTHRHCHCVADCAAVSVTDESREAHHPVGWMHDRRVWKWSLCLCRRIEAWSDTKFSAEQLPPEVATWTRDRLSRVQAAQDPAFVTFVQSIAGTLLGRGPPAVKVNLLAFLETLAVSSDASGLLINSALTPALVQLFGYTSGGSAMRSRCATVLGIMIRYATVIDTEAIVPGVPRPCRWHHAWWIVCKRDLELCGNGPFTVIHPDHESVPCCSVGMPRVDGTSAALCWWCVWYG